MSLFNAWYTKSHAIEEFEVAQNQTLDQAGNGLRDNWVIAVQLAFKTSFKDVGKPSQSVKDFQTVPPTLINHCSSLQSIVWPAADISHAKAQSYSFHPA